MSLIYKTHWRAKGPRLVKGMHVGVTYMTATPLLTRDLRLSISNALCVCLLGLYQLLPTAQQ